MFGELLVCRKSVKKKEGIMKRGEAGFLFFGFETTHDRTQLVKMDTRTEDSS
jgi:hypothetical protein